MVLGDPDSSRSVRYCPVLYSPILSPSATRTELSVRPQPLATPPRKAGIFVCAGVGVLSKLMAASFSRTTARRLTHDAD